MVLNILITFKSGKKQALLDIPYKKKQEQLDEKTRNGTIIDFRILPSDFAECKKILEKEGVEI